MTGLMMLPEVSVVLITRNEATRIRRCLDSVKWADELIVVDQHSMDGTPDICCEYGAKVITRAMDAGFGEQKNFAVAQASKPWILSLDADEVVTPELQRAIFRAIDDPGEVVGYRIPRLTSYLGRFIRHCGWYPRPVLRLFRKGRGRFTDALVHEEVLADGPVGDLDEDLLHYSYDSIGDHLRKLDLYTTYDAQMLARRGIHFSPLGWPYWFFAKPLLVFLKKYLWQLGALEGRGGFVLSVMAAVAVFVNHVKLSELQRRQSRTTL
jgi:glycosyltransferase involved in cell wall biosynthesis